MFAKLSTDITFESLNGNTVTIPTGTYILIDWDQMVATALGYHFDIDLDEVVSYQ